MLEDTQISRIVGTMEKGLFQTESKSNWCNLKKCITDIQIQAYNGNITMTSQMAEHYTVIKGVVTCRPIMDHDKIIIPDLHNREVLVQGDSLVFDKDKKIRKEQIQNKDFLENRMREIKQKDIFLDSITIQHNRTNMVVFCKKNTTILIDGKVEQCLPTQSFQIKDMNEFDIRVGKKIMGARHVKFQHKKLIKDVNLPQEMLGYVNQTKEVETIDFITDLLNLDQIDNINSIHRTISFSTIIILTLGISICCCCLCPCCRQVSIKISQIMCGSIIGCGQRPDTAVPESDLDIGIIDKLLSTIGDYFSSQNERTTDDEDEQQQAEESPTAGRTRPGHDNMENRATTYRLVEPPAPPSISPASPDHTGQPQATRGTAHRTVEQQGPHVLSQ